MRTLIKKLDSLVGSRVKICGWVEKLRDQKRMQFLVIRDHTGTIQAINDKTANTKLAQIISGLTIESAVEITGSVVANEAIKLGGLEITMEEIRVVNRAETPLPLNPNAMTENRLDWRFLDLRLPQNRLIFEVQTAAEEAMRQFWNENGFIEIHSPKFMESASESGGELFRVEYFDRYAYLAQSPQFYKQMAMAAGFDRIFEIGPVFRANPSFTSRHDTEFTSVDIEMSWIDSHEDVMHMEERWMQYVLQSIQSNLGVKIKNTLGVEIVVPTLPFPRVTMAEAYSILDNAGYQITRAEKGDLDPEGERTLAAYIAKEFGHEFVFVTDYPASVRAFYHMRYPDRPETTKSFDLIWKGLEITTGAQREHRHEVLISQVLEKGLNPDSIKYYLDFFRFGCPPHGGYGFGLTRMLMMMLDRKNVREVTYLYRGVNRLTP